MVRLALAAMLVAACERERPSGGAPADTARVAEAPRTVAKGGCPATGNWSSCAVFDRLDRAGLAPRLDTAPVTEPPLAPAGQLVRLGTSELELYTYPNATARERDAAKLDRSKYLAYDAPQPMRPLPTLIQSANLIAILHSRNEHQRERVSDAITAGPPQPARP